LVLVQVHDLEFPIVEVIILGKAPMVKTPPARSPKKTSPKKNSPKKNTGIRKYYEKSINSPAKSTRSHLSQATTISSKTTNKGSLKKTPPCTNSAKKKKRKMSDPDCSITSIASSGASSQSSTVEGGKKKKDDDMPLLPVELYGEAEQEVEKERILEENEFEKNVIITFRRDKKAVRAACYKYGYVHQVKLPNEWLTDRKAKGTFFFFEFYFIFMFLNLIFFLQKL
jgi:hypothetical protein